MSDFHEMLLDSSWIVQKLKKLFTNNNNKKIDPYFSYPPKKENIFLKIV